MIRRCKVEGRFRALFDSFVVVELCPIVGSDGLELPLVTVDEVDDSSVERGGRPIFELADQEHAGLSLDQRDDAILTAGADDRVDLPVPRLAAPLDHRGTLRDEPFSGQSATT